MPRRAYVKDLQQLATDSGVATISNVCAGDDDGEFRFTITSEDGAAYQISALIPDLGDYPSGHEYHIFGEDSAPAHIGQVIHKLPSTTGLSLAELLEVVANAFAEKGDGDAYMLDSQGSPYRDVPTDGDNDGPDDLDDSDDEEHGFSEDQMFGGAQAGFHFSSNTPGQSANALKASEKARQRLRGDLRSAKVAGFKVGHHGPLLECDQNAFVTISVRISKLGISEEAMQAWQLIASEYLILVIQYPSGYQSLDDIGSMDASTVRKTIGFRVGVSSQYKPTLQEAQQAFTKLSKEEEARKKTEEVIEAKTSTDTNSSQRGFRDAFISRPMNELLNDRLATIIRYRSLGMHWAGAEEFYNDYQGKTFTMTGMDYLEDKYVAEETRHPSFPSIVTNDHMQESKPGDPQSLPLLAMQFLLRHFVRCTEFCLVCHCKLDNDLEALKPYVCDKPLCLYQYMSLGFGPSIEHEIMAQPSVVDLLITFCYHSATAGKLGDFPNGLSLNVPPPAILSQYGTTPTFYAPYTAPQQPSPAVTPTQDDVSTYKAKINRETREIMFEKGGSCPVRPGEWICFKAQGSEAESTPPNLEHCRVLETHLFPVIKFSEPVSRMVETDTQSDLEKRKSTKAIGNRTKIKPAGFTEFVFYSYSTNFDNLTDSQKRGAIVQQLDILPPVDELKKYLITNRTSTLSSWVDRISPAASGILRWIIASNRACIMEVDGETATTNDSRVEGMDGWIQFRFAMGAPDKERRFLSEVQATQARLKLNFPTLFAWHGSPLFNWHSIIREGLHFKDISHGRAFGNGCYHSLDLNTSLGYSGYGGRGFYNSGSSVSTWPSSALKVSCAMALNEIVNAPSEFVSKSPHLVVAQLDWIQTRYLFVQSSDQNLRESQSAKITDKFPQDTSVTPNGAKGTKIVVPMTAMPKSRRLANGSAGTTDHQRVHKKMRQSGTLTDPITIDVDISDTASITTDVEDLNILIDDEVDYIAAPTGTITNSQTMITKGKSKLTGLFNGLKSKAKVVSPSKPMTDFEPGKLDYATLPLLGEPAFATPSASKRLQREFQTLLKVQQSSHLHELGWYTNPEQFNNMYQWIVELHSFDQDLPLAKQLKKRDIKSVVMEMRFGPDYPMSPPFIRVIRPRFLSFMAGGGGHITAGGSICMELLTNSGWSAVSSIESVLLQVRMAISSTDPRPAQLDNRTGDYGVGEAIEAYVRACQTHGWTLPPNFRETAMGGEAAGRGFYDMH